MTLERVLDHVTDIAAVAAIGGIILYGGTNPSDATLAAITSIALGKRYMRLKGGGK